MDIVLTGGPDRGKTVSAIYSFQGGVWIVCFNPPGKERPTTFDTEKHSDARPLYLHRAPR
jgi:uncharacterized protein (TIGR03067 family)